MATKYSSNGTVSDRKRIKKNLYHLNAKQTADFGIVLREFYPPEMSNERCHEYENNQLERPIETLERATREAEKRNNINSASAVVHWFKSDLRFTDNKALATAYRLVSDLSIP